MGGRASRDKGKRGEYAVRDLLRLEGFTADRVPLSGASQAYKGDIKFSKEGKTYLAEVKVRTKGTFKHIYQELAERLGTGATGVFDLTGRAVIVADNAQDVLTYEGTYIPLGPGSKACKQITKIKEFVKGCDILVIKEDHKPFLFIRYL